ncbi:glutamine-hydrolyzing GMP synthase subunit GuaA [Candidatus Micrarchaeota archaeon]|nr:glutamine-hydrolyzing GMP synthase subunit GuaA [Candidatus Micrarchaeota archaeon]
MVFNPEKFTGQAIADIKKTIGNAKTITALSGGVDSFVAATLAAKSIPGQLTAIYVNTGLMRKGETEQVQKTAKSVGVPLTVIEAREKFFAALKGADDPEKKRKIIGELFVRIFEEEAKKHGVTYLIQGTIAPDWIESGGLGRDTIKSHHNVGGLPEKMHLKLCEPLRELYKHEVRMVARHLGLPDSIAERQPFPGPALAIRIVGEVTPEKVEIVREACAIVEEELEAAAKSKKMEMPWQYFAALLPTKTVGVRGDERAYQYVVVVRAVRSLDGMTANFSHVPHEVLERISTRITNEIRSVGRVVYDITNKPPSTVEME